MVINCIKMRNGGDYEIFKYNDNDVAIEEPNSNFNQHRLQVIKYSIEKNLSIAIANYNGYSTQTSTNFQMPKLKEEEWEKILNNVSIISFLQGLNIGGKVYNGYSIITNTKNEEVVSEDSIYITTSDGQYHKATDSDLIDNRNIRKGYLNIDFERKSITSSEGVATYFFPHGELGCYSSIVNSSTSNDEKNIYDYMEDKGNLAQIYFTALGRERYSMYKTDNNSEDLLKEFQN